MERVFTVLEIIVPIAVTILLGVTARRRQILTREGVDGLQQFLVKFVVPCVLFNSCLTCTFAAETMVSLALEVTLLAALTAVAFRVRRGKRFTYGNLPMAFCAQESGMLGISLFLVLFGPAHVYRIAVLDAIQVFLAAPVMAILTAGGGSKRLHMGELVKKTLFSPILIAGLLGLTMNLTGAIDWLETLGVAGILTETTGFLAAPISAAILFTLGYNFDLSGEEKKDALAMSAIHLGIFTLFCLLMQGIYTLMGDVAAETRWAMLLYCMLPPTFLSSSLGRDSRDKAFAAAFCSLRTVVTLAVFCVMAVLTQ